MKCNQNKISSAKGIPQIQNRRKYKLDQYRKCKDNNSKSGRSCKDTENFDEPDEILGCQNAVYLKYTLDTYDYSETIENPQSTDGEMEPFDENEAGTGEFSYSCQTTTRSTYTGP